MTHPTTSRRRRRSLACLAGTMLALAACGGGNDETLVGYRIEPLRNVGGFTVEAASAGSKPFPIRADPGRLLLVFLGFTNCPDACPTALAEIRQAIDRLGANAEPLDVAMLTVDPTRDTSDVHTAYVRGFVDRGIALRTDDANELRQIADAFGATYDTAHDHTGATTDVGHPTRPTSSTPTATSSSPGPPT